MLPIAASLWPYYTLQPPAVHTQLARSALAPAHAFQPKKSHICGTIHMPAWQENDKIVTFGS